MKKYFVSFIILIVGMTSIVVTCKITRVRTAKVAIKEISTQFGKNKKAYEDLVFTFEILPIEPYEARMFSFMWKEKKIRESVCYKNTNTFKTTQDESFLNGRHLMSISRIFDYLEIESLVHYENNYIRIKSDLYNIRLKKYSLLYTDNWKNELPKLISNYVVIYDLDELDENDKWIFILNENWAVMN